MWDVKEEKFELETEGHSLSYVYTSTHLANPESRCCFQHIKVFTGL